MAIKFPPTDGYLAECKAAVGLKLPLKKDARKTLQTIVDRLKFSRVRNRLGRDDFDAEEFLNRKKLEFDLLLAAFELKGWLSGDVTGLMRSRFADASIQFALMAVCRRSEFESYLSRANLTQRAVPAGLFVLGLGKLGGQDLNFSSDVDLICYFDTERLPVSDEYGKGYVCTRLMQEMTDLLSSPGEFGFVWRVDWRLRPEASINPLAMSSEMAEEFYRYRALPWHRLALCKARVVAGDLDCGNAFLADLDSYIWQRNLDYRSIDELYDLKKRINAEHPGLEVERQNELRVEKDSAGFNLKLGRGGIREIEFIVNALQLVWGGRKPDLRTGHTMTALSRLARQKLIEPDIAKHLEAAYWYLRGLENRLQMVDNDQMHEVPDAGASRKRWLALNSESWSTINRRIYDYRRMVSAEFDSVFADGSPPDQGKAMPIWVSDLDTVAREVVGYWEDGFQVYGTPNSQALSMRDLAHAVLGLIDEYAEDRDQAVRIVDEFFRSLPPGGQYFRLLMEFPRLLDSVIPPLVSSPLMTHLLSQSPHIVDALIEDGGRFEKQSLVDGLQLIIDEPREEVQMNALRRFINEQLYALYFGFLSGREDARTTTDALTLLAQHAIEAGLEIVRRKMRLKKIPLTVLGLGKMGIGNMAPASDLDLIYVAAANVSVEKANEFSSRMHTLMSAKMREGVVYEMDMRLRPSGASGPPTVSVNSFHDYQMTYARTWEHLALVAARVVAGDSATGKRVFDEIDLFLKKPRDQEQLINDAAKMHGMLIDQRIDEDDEKLNVKLRRGGLLEAEYLANVVFLQAMSQAKIKPARYQDLWPEIARLGYSGLGEAIEFWRPLQLWERLLSLQERSPDAMPEKYSQRLFASVGVNDVNEFEQAVRHHSEQVIAAADELFASAPSGTALDDWPDETIRWK